MDSKTNQLSHADWVFQAAASITQIYEGDIYDDAKASGSLGNALSRAVFVYSSLHSNGQSLEFIRDHVKRYGPLSPEATYYLMKLSESCGYSEKASQIGRQAIKLHRNNTKRTAFVEWATKHISEGKSPSNVVGIKRLDGFDKEWGTDDTIKKWWRTIKDAPALKPGASRT